MCVVIKLFMAFLLQGGEGVISWWDEKMERGGGHSTSSVIKTRGYLNAWRWFLNLSFSANKMPMSRRELSNLAGWLARKLHGG